eukprot:1560969-Amphidinium_carterae.1
MERWVCPIIVLRVRLHQQTPHDWLVEVVIVALKPGRTFSDTRSCSVLFGNTPICLGTPDFPNGTL